jgi:hypothetical protein
MATGQRRFLGTCLGRVSRTEHINNHTLGSFVIYLTPLKRSAVNSELLEAGGIFMFVEKALTSLVYST